MRDSWSLESLERYLGWLETLAEAGAAKTDLGAPISRANARGVSDAEIKSRVARLIIAHNAMIAAGDYKMSPIVDIHVWANDPNIPRDDQDIIARQYPGWEPGDFKQLMTHLEPVWRETVKKPLPKLWND